MLKRRLVVIAVFAFFFGLPFFGMLAMYRNIHAVMRASGEKFALKSIDEVLVKPDWAALEDYGTLTLKQNLKKESFNGWMDRFGPFKNVTDLKVTRSWVSTRGDHGWQLVSFTSDARFRNGPATLKITVARRSVELDEWRIEDFQLLPQTVE